MKKIKNKIIKILGGITFEEHTKDKEIAFWEGIKKGCDNITVYMKDYILNPNTDNSDLAIKTCEHAYNIYEEAKSKLINLKTK